MRLFVVLAILAVVGGGTLGYLMTQPAIPEVDARQVATDRGFSVTDIQQQLNGSQKMSVRFGARCSGDFLLGGGADVLTADVPTGNAGATTQVRVASPNSVKLKADPAFAFCI